MEAGEEGVETTMGVVAISTTHTTSVSVATTMVVAPVAGPPLPVPLKPSHQQHLHHNLQLPHLNQIIVKTNSAVASY